MLITGHMILDALDFLKERVKALERRVKKQRLPFLKISAATGEGITPLLEAAWKEIAQGVRLKADTATADTTIEVRLASDEATAIEKPDTTSEERAVVADDGEQRNARVRRKA